MRGHHDSNADRETVNKDHLSFQTLVLDLSARLIDVAASSIDDHIRLVLAEIGEFVQADRSYVFLMRDSGQIADNTHEWCSPNALPQAHRLQGLDLAAQLPWFAAKIRKFEVFHVPRVSELPLEADAERQEFEAESIKSLLVVPMVQRGVLSGFLGFDAVREERIWTPEAVAVLRIVGQMLGSALERARVERDLAQSEDRFRSLVEYTSDWVWEVDASGTYTYVSPKVKELLGWRPEEVIGRPAFDFMLPGEARRMLAVFEEHASHRQPLRSVENRLRHRDGHDVWVETSGVPVIDPDGALRGYRGIDRDMSERRRAEQERRALEARVRETQRLESLGLLAGGIAHDFNNLLTAVLGQSSLARLLLPAEHEAQRSLRLVTEAAYRASELTRQLLAYSGRAPFVKSIVDLSSMAGEMGPLLEASTSTKGLLSWALRDEPLPVEGDVSQFRQVVMNLVINACDAVAGKTDGAVTVTTGMARLVITELSQSFFEPQADGTDVAYLEVEDNGGGIAPEVLPRVFDPFFSTKSQSRGLGLSAVVGIVRGHRGGVLVVTHVGAGTRFRVLLPLARRTTATVEPPLEPRPPQTTQRGCVLVIDDDPLVRSAASMILAARGYEVCEAQDGAEGLKAFEADAARIDAVLLDMTMPGLNGAQVAERLRRIRPEVRILVASGFPAAETAERMAASPPEGYLEKPFSAESLLIAMARLIAPSDS